MKILAANKKARHDYKILDTLEVGIKLAGPEVKSIKNAQVSLKESFIKIEGGELFIKNMHVSPYKFARQEEYNPTRDRKLLASKKEIKNLSGRMTKEKLAIIPLSAYLKNNKIKLEIALVKGKKKWDKREDIKKKEMERELRKRKT